MVNDKRGISKPRNRISFRFRGDKVAVTFTISKLSNISSVYRYRFVSNNS